VTDFASETGQRELRSLLLVSYEWPPLGGGGGVILCGLARELARQIEVTVLTSGAAGLPEVERSGALEVIRAPVFGRKQRATASLPSLLSFFPASMRRGMALLRERSFDIVHSSFAVPSGPSGLLLARRAGIPHVVSVHGGDIYDPSKWLSPHRIAPLRRTVRWVMQGSQRVLTSSQDIEDRVRSHYRIESFERIPLAVEPLRSQPDDFSSRVGERAGEPATPTLITIGRLVRRKGIDLLLDALGGLVEQPWKLVIVGDGPERGRLAEHARQRGIGDRVRFAGFVDEERKHELLCAADLYVSGTLHEGFGIVFLEAMQHELPVVAPDCGGQRDFIDESVGALVPVGDVPALRRAIEAHLCNDALRLRKGRAARGRATEYELPRYAERHLQVYRKCLSDRGVR